MSHEHGWEHPEAFCQRCGRPNPVWSAPNDLRVEILGRRAAARSRDIRLTSSFDRPWFVPRALGDSIRVFGNEIPPQAAVHPLARDGAEWYSYRLSDSVLILALIT